MADSLVERENLVIQFKNAEVQPPGDLYMTRDDALVITSYNSATGITVHVRYTMLRADGKVIVGAIDTHVPNTDRTAATTRQPLGEGFLLSATVFLGSGSAKRGQCYVQVGIARGVGVAQFIHRIILQGYVGTATNLAWPGNRLEQPVEGPGNIRIITGTNPAAGAEWLEVVPTGARWRLLSLLVTLTTSATAGVRRVELDIGTLGATVFSSPHYNTQLASLTKSFAWACGAALGSQIAGNDDPAVLPAETTIPAGTRIESTTTNLQVGDDFSAPKYLVEEWIEP